MKSQREYPVRRLAVFAGYREMETLWSRPVRRESDREPIQREERVVVLEPLTRVAELQRAA